MKKCEHALTSDVIDGTTFVFCEKCFKTIHGSQEEFPNKAPSEIMQAFASALPESPAGGFSDLEGQV